MFIVEIDVDPDVNGPLHGELAALVSDALAARAPGYAQRVRVSWRDPRPIRLGSCCFNVGTDKCRCENPTNWGPPESRCPGCGFVKFVGHGPLCGDCFGLAITPVERGGDADA